MKKRKERICFVASSGGHWEELMCLSKITEEYDAFYVTEEGGQIRDSNLENAYILPQINRHEKFFLIHFCKMFREARKIIRKEKPSIVISTGALIAYPFCILIKISGGKVIYIESFARVNKKSLTGRLVYPFADLFLIQWEELKKVYPKAKYIGGIF